MTLFSKARRDAAALLVRGAARIAGKPAASFAEATAARKAGTPGAVMPDHISQDLARILRPQAAYRWLLPQLAAITPQYIEMTLRGALAGSHVQAWELFDLMEDSWPRLLKNERELKAGVLNLARQFTPYTDEDTEPTDSAKQKARLVSAAMRSMRPDPTRDENAFDGTIFDILDAWFKGQTVLEVDWECRQCGGLGTAIVPRATYWVHPTCYAWDMAGMLGLRLELTPNLTPSGTSADYASRLNPKSNYPPLTPGTWQSTTYQPMPGAVMPFMPDKFLVCISKAKSGTALGGALLRPLAWWWCAANFSADWLMNLAQIFGLPFRWANYDPSAPQATVDAICAMLQNMGSNAWAAFPAGTTLELKEAGKSGDNNPAGDLLDRADKQCDLLVLGQTLTSDTGGMGKGRGSMALGKVHAGVKEEIIYAAAKYVCGVLETQLFPNIIRLNYAGLGMPALGVPPRGDVVNRSAGSYFVPDLEVPCLTLASDKEEDLAAEAQVIAALVQAGAGKRIGLDWLGKRFGIPKPQPGEETLGDAERDAGPPEGGTPNGLASESAAANRSPFGVPRLRGLAATAAAEGPGSDALTAKRSVRRARRDAPYLGRAGSPLPAAAPIGNEGHEIPATASSQNEIL